MYKWLTIFTATVKSISIKGGMPSQHPIGNMFFLKEPPALCTLECMHHIRNIKLNFKLACFKCQLKHLASKFPASGATYTKLAGRQTVFICSLIRVKAIPLTTIPLQVFVRYKNCLKKINKNIKYNSYIINKP